MVRGGGDNDSRIDYSQVLNVNREKLLELNRRNLLKGLAGTSLAATGIPSLASAPAAAESTSDGFSDDFSSGSLDDYVVVGGQRKYWDIEKKIDGDSLHVIGHADENTHLVVDPEKEVWPGEGTIEVDFKINPGDFNKNAKIMFGPVDDLTRVKVAVQGDNINFPNGHGESVNLPDDDLYKVKVEVEGTTITVRLQNHPDKGPFTHELDEPIEPGTAGVGMHTQDFKTGETWFDNLKITGSTEEEPNLNIVDPRLVQRVENTRVLNDDGEVVKRESDPSFVEGLNAAVMFNLRGRNLSSLPDEIPFKINYHGISRKADKFVVSKGDILVGMQDDGYLGSKEFETRLMENKKGDTPIFRFQSDLKRITVTVGDQDTDFTQSKTTAVLQNQSTVPVPAQEFNIGVVPLMHPEYGSVTKVKDVIKPQVTELLSILPTAQINVYILDQAVRGIGDNIFSDNILTADQEVTIDGAEVRKVLEDRLPVQASFSQIDGGDTEDTGVTISEFDITIGVVPDNSESDESGYFEYHNMDSENKKETKGFHPRYGHTPESDDDPESQPPAGAIIETGGNNTLLAHEVGHHLLGEPYDGEYASKGGDRHASDNLCSDAYNLVNNQFNTRQSVISWMAASGTGVLDSAGYKVLLKNGLTPVPDEGGTTTEFLLRAVMLIDETGVTVYELATSLGGVITDVPQGSITVNITGLDGETLNSQNLPKVIGQVSGGTKTKNHSSQFIVGNIEFPKETYELTVSSDTVSETINPVEETLRQALRSVPDHAFKRAADGRREALNNKLDAIDDQMDQKAFRAAKRKLKKDFRDKIEKWLKNSYDAAANEFTKRELFNLTDEMVSRLDTLAASDTSRRGRNIQK